jgi:hypothetical protein
LTADFTTLLKGAKLPERTVDVCLRGDLRTEFEALERELEQAQQRAADSLAGPGTDDLVARIEAVQAEMREHTYRFVLRAMPKPAWRGLIADHPPRRDPDGTIVDEDRIMEINVGTFWDDLIRRSIIDPVLDDDAWTQLQDALTDYQFSELGAAAWGLNRSEVDVPFSHVVSKMRRDSAGG